MSSLADARRALRIARIVELRNILHEQTGTWLAVDTKNEMVCVSGTWIQFPMARRVMEVKARLDGIQL